MAEAPKKPDPNPAPATNEAHRPTGPILRWLLAFPSAFSYVIRLPASLGDPSPPLTPGPVPQELVERSPIP